MVGFAHPEALLLAPLAAAVGWWHVRRRRPALTFSAVALFDGLPSRRATLANGGGATLRALAVLSVVVALAGPRLPDLRTPIPAEGVAIVFVLDASGSMATEDYAPAGGPPASRLDAAKAAFRLFVAGGDAPDGTPFPGRPRDRIGLVSFAAVPRTVCPLTANHSVLLKLADGVSAAVGVDAGSNVGDAIAEGVARLEAAGPRRKVLVLLSDGEHNATGDPPDAPLTPRQAAKLAKALGVPVFAVDCGGDPLLAADAAAAKQRRDGRAVLDDVAATTDGRAFAANDADQLRDVYRQIDGLTRTPAETNRYRRHREFYPHFAAAAVGLMGLVYLLEATWWRRLP